MNEIVVPLRTLRRANFPPLAWHLDLSGVPTLNCGNAVCLWPNGFFEGAWAAAFDECGFDKAADVFGSGAQLTPSGWLLVSPSHTLECIYVLRHSGKWSASNSLACLLRNSGARFRSPSYRLS